MSPASGTHHHLHRVADHLATLIETAFYHTEKELLITVKSALRSLRLRCMTADLTFGGGEKTILTYCEEIFNIIPGPEKHAENTVYTTSRSRADALRHFFLHHAGHLRHHVTVLEDFEKDLAGNIIGEIAYYGNALCP